VKRYTAKIVLWSDATENPRAMLTYMSSYEITKIGYIFHFKHLKDILLHLSDLKISE